MRSLVNCLRTFLGCWFISVLSMSGNATAATANDAPPQSDGGWHVSFAPYGWLSGVDGNITLKGNTTHVHIPFKDIFKNLDFAGEVHLEANKGRWTFMIDPTYLKLSKDIKKSLSKTINVPANGEAVVTAIGTLTSATTLIDLGAFYRLFSTPDNKPYVSFELLGGARYLGLNNSLEYNRYLNVNIDDQTFAQLRSFDASTNDQMISPIIGARIKFNPTPNAHLWLRGDGGGFGIDHVTRTLSGIVGFAYTVHRHIDLGIAYRVLEIAFHKTNSSGDIVMYGPMIGISFYS